VTDPFFFRELPITSYVFLDMPQNYVIPQTEDDPDFSMQLGAAPPYFCPSVCEGLTDSFPGIRTGRVGHLGLPI
jgi:hypothetical protein